jgi:hypothetical protein
MKRKPRKLTHWIELALFVATALGVVYLLSRSWI